VVREFTTLERARLIERRRGSVVLTDPGRLARLIEGAQGLEGGPRAGRVSRTAGPA
jgi:hypothetical protein